MNISLKPFQKSRVAELRQKAAVAQMNLMHFGQKQIISFTAPTGAGKTIMMASFIEAMMCGDEDGMVAAIPESIFIWLSDDPQLNEQSKQKLVRYCDKLVITQFSTLDEAFRGEYLEQGKVYFLNTQKLGKGNKMITTADGRDWTIWETIQNTIEEYGRNLVLIIDEAHRGAKVNQTTIMQKFVNGSSKDGLEALPLIIGMSATPERFNTLAGSSASTLSKVIVTPKEVRDSGLLKDTIEIHYPEPSVINKNIAVLQAAADEWKDKCLHWYNYTEKQHYPNVCPIFVVQVEPAAGGKVSSTDLDECIREIEKRTGDVFETGEVIHAFGEKSPITINGLEVPYCEPSAINDDRKIKVVLFKEALSTGWDCPRAECMMSYRKYGDETYIAQLLGRMIRTPQRMRIAVDESLNYVHLYLPHFDKETVEKVVKKINDEEGGALPADVQTVQGGHKTTVKMTTKRPITPQQPSTMPSSNTAQTSTQPANANQESGITETEEKTLASNTQGNCVTTHPVDVPTERVTSQVDTPLQGNATLSPDSETVIDDVQTNQDAIDPYEQVKDAINNAEILTFIVKTAVETKNFVRALFDMARLAVNSCMDSSCSAVENVKDAIADKMHQYISELKAEGKYKELVDKALEFQLNTLSVELYKGGNSTYEVQQGPDLFSVTDAGLSHQYIQAETLLCGESIGTRYDDKYCKDENENTYMYDTILYAADNHQRDLLMDYAKTEFFRLADLYRSKTKNIEESYRLKYNDLVYHGSIIRPILFHLPETINVDLDNDGETCSDHLFVNNEGTAKFKFTSWENVTLKEERNHPDYICWLRNQDRKPWALCIPYQLGNETHRMYPDFIIVRKDNNNGYGFALLEPHRDDKKDNLAKAKGLIKYAQECTVFSRIQMMRKKHTAIGDKMLRLELTSMQVQKKIMNCVTEEDFDKVFNSEGFMD